VRIYESKNPPGTIGSTLFWLEDVERRYDSATGWEYAAIGTVHDDAFSGTHSSRMAKLLDGIR
jgi:hypothetical protein